MSPSSTPTRRWIALTGLLVAEAMNLLDSTITTVAAPVIRAGLYGTASDTQWIAAAYTLPFAVALVPGGRLGDIHGRRRLFVIGVCGFLLASTACTAAPTMTALLVARVVQGCFAGLVVPQTIGLIRAAFDGPALGRALSLIGPVMGLTSVAGPVLGGLITHADLAGLSWRAVFLVNVPLGLLTLVWARFLDEDRPARRPGLDVPGFLLSGAVAAAFVIPTINGGTSWVLLAAGFLGAAVLAAHVRRRGASGRDPVFEPSLFHDRGFPAALASSVLYFAVSTGVVFTVVLHVEDGLHRSVLASSLTVLPFSAGLAVSSLLAGQLLLPRTGPGLMFAGIVLLAAGLVWGVAVPSWLPAALGVSGLGGGLVTVPFFAVALSRVRPHETGSAAGLLNAVQQLGGTFGVAVLGGAYLGTRSLTAPFVVSLALGAALTLSVALMLGARAGGTAHSHAPCDCAPG
ncbi:MFS transporter [Streptosporangium sp. NPDC049376]|uniref:MFS transporter n=1 Tax=Streptosporangium sp. NPDC049376 TaxID=3366192 RepID=UPI0037B7CF44